MAFSNIYDVTQPPDTQLANLLGLDLRNLALNVQQRMAAISGTFSAQPPIGSDAQPLNWTGLLYFCTDTGQILQWSGSAWVDITSQIAKTTFKNVSNIVHNGDITEDTIYTDTVAAGVLGTNGILRGTVAFQSTIATSFWAIRVRFGGTQVAVYQGPASGTGLYILKFQIANQNSASVQFAFSNLDSTVSGGNPSVSFGTAAINTAVVQNLTITMQNAVGSDSQTFGTCFVEQL
jgi:hypothetical protein